MAATAFRILLVEDNPGDARLIRELLYESGIESPSVEVAATLSAAGALLREREPQVLLLDLSLPDAHGLDTVTSALAVAPKVPIIVLTGLADQKIALQAVQSGAQDYLVKGEVDGPALGRAIRYAIERKQLALELERLLGGEKDARASAEAALRARDQVLRVVSHDLGNHLAAIRINARVLTRTIGGDGVAEDLLERAAGILQQVSAMERLRQDLLDTVSLEAGRLSVAREMVDPLAIARQTAEDVRPLADTREIELVIRADDGLPQVNADADRIRQALGNLLGNGVKFSPAGEAVTLDVSIAEGRLVYIVSDAGPGIPADDEPYIFDSFWKSSAGNPTGAGLGLSIVKGIAEAHGGSAWYEKRPAGGSSFYFAVPIA